MKEVRAVVLGLIVVALLALLWGFFRRPAPGMKRVGSFRVEIHDREGGRHNDISVRIPGFLAGKAIKLATEAFTDENLRDYRFVSDDRETVVTPRDILEAARRSSPDKPVSIDLGRHDARLEVSRAGTDIRVVVRDEDRDRQAEILVPETLLEGLAQDQPLSARELLGRIDGLGPGEIVSIRTDDAEVRITAESR
jgi:hypothetical protein